MKTLILYGSTTGNTEDLATILKDHLISQKLETDLKEVTEADGEIFKAYDLILLGCSTWGEGELQEDFEEFYEKMDAIGFNGKKCAVFGPGDEDNYPDTFGAAVDILEEKLSDLGATKIIEGLKIDENNDNGGNLLCNWVDQLLDEINSAKREA